MKTIVRFYNCVIKIYSWFINKHYWLRHPLMEEIVREEITLETQNLNELHDVKCLMARFKWRTDGLLIDWHPWVKTIIARRLCDDCEGAALLAQWALSVIGISSRIVYLVPGWKFWKAHVVCVSIENNILVSNGMVVEFDGNTRERLQKFYSKYTIVYI